MAFWITLFTEPCGKTRLGSAAVAVLRHTAPGQQGVSVASLHQAKRVLTEPPRMPPEKKSQQVADEAWQRTKCSASTQAPQFEADTQKRASHDASFDGLALQSTSETQVMESILRNGLPQACNLRDQNHLLLTWTLFQVSCFFSFLVLFMFFLGGLNDQTQRKND